MFKHWIRGMHNPPGNEFFVNSNLAELAILVLHSTFPLIRRSRHILASKTSLSDKKILATKIIFRGSWSSNLWFLNLTLCHSSTESGDIWLQVISVTLVNTLIDFFGLQWFSWNQWGMTTALEVSDLKAMTEW